MRLILLLLCTLTLPACFGSTAKIPDIRYYTLEYDSPVVSGTPVKAVILLNRFGVAPEINTAKMIYRDLAFGRQEYAYHQWRVPPQTMVMDYLRRDLRDSGLFTAVDGPTSTLPATFELEGIVEKWMEVDGADQWSAEAELTVTLIDMRTRFTPDRVLFQRVYRAGEVCAKKNPAAVAAAMSAAMRTLSEKIIADVYAAVKDIP